MDLEVKIKLNYWTRYWTGRLLFFSLVTSFVGCLVGYSTVSSAWEEKSELAEIQPNAVFTMPGDPKVSSFRFAAGKVYLLSSGDVKVEGWLKHKGLLCSTYEIGVQFGKGSARGCEDVEWLNGPIFMTNRSHCNNANLEHRGFATNQLLQIKYPSITCAKRIIKCSGICQSGSGYISNNP